MHHIVDVYVKLWPPFFEEDISKANMCIGFAIDEDPGKIIFLGTNDQDIYTLKVWKEEIPTDDKIFNNIEHRIELWINGQLDGVLDYEYYKLSDDYRFKNIVNEFPRSVQVLSQNEMRRPFGIKMDFERDFVITCPSFDGSHFGTMLFNHDGILKNIKYMEKYRCDYVR